MRHNLNPHLKTKIPVVIFADCERESGTQRLQEAVKICCAALQDRSREQVPLQWARAQDNLGNALLALGMWTQDRAKLQEARNAVNSAFETFMQAGQEQYRRYFEHRLREIDRQLAVQSKH